MQKMARCCEKTLIFHEPCKERKSSAVPHGNGRKSVPTMLAQREAQLVQHATQHVAAAQAPGTAYARAGLLRPVTLGQSLFALEAAQPFVIGGDSGALPCTPFILLPEQHGLLRQTRLHICRARRVRPAYGKTKQRENLRRQAQFGCDLGWMVADTAGIHGTKPERFKSNHRILRRN